MKIKLIRALALGFVAFVFLFLITFENADAKSSAETDLVELSRLIDKFSQEASNPRGAPTTEFNPSKALLAEIFNLLPESNHSFAELVQRYPAQAPPAVTVLRQSIREALRISAARTELRIEALVLLRELMQKHAALAAGPHGSEFLTYFGIWQHEITGGRERTHAQEMSVEEFRRTTEITADYRRGFNAMMCARMFR